MHVSHPRPHRRATALVGAAVLALAMSACAASDPSASPTPAAPSGIPEQTSAELQAVLDDLYTEGVFPGAIARVITPEGEWVGTVGASAEGGTTAPAPGDRTRVGSITKTMTATILLQLVDEGLVTLDDPISKYVADSPNGTATLRQLADMTSGIPSYSLDDGWQAKLFGDPYSIFTPQELIDDAKALPLVGAPGEKWQYSNTNYVLLGMVIESVLDQPIADVFQERIFDPVGMADTVYPGDSNEIAQPHLSGITEQGQDAGVRVDATDWSPTGASTAGEVISTLDDLTLWAHALFTGDDVLSPEMQQLRRDSILTSPPPNNADNGYGIGWGHLPNGWWGHNGEIPGFTTSVFHDYDQEATIVVVVNSDIPMSSEKGPAPTIFEALAEVLG
ncbi:serine hydrolase domain-containing protein [Microbacterium aoyamense]|uniref:Serine hydrolase domain-containing protein n=1 Tax=Microbacterium aoyamense TaxID=344166 RepID=A0ABP5AU82_9MICO|nr:serine hydrolase domain-containing protein [Microbacterium aoyamense]